MEAGSITVKINGDITDLQTAINKMSTELDKGAKKAQEHSQSILGAMLSYEAIKRAIDTVINVVKESVKAFQESELAETRLKSVIGGNITAYKDYANEIQRTTTFQDDAIVQALALAKTMGVENESLTKVTNGAIGLSKAFNLDLTTAMRASVLASQGNVEALKRIIPELRTTKDVTEMQSIVQEAMNKGLKIAQDETATFSGKLMQLTNEQNNVQESIGKITSMIGKDYVDSILKAARGLSSFLDEQQKQSAIVSLLDKWIKQIAALPLGLIESLKELFKPLRAGSLDLDVFANALKGLATGLTIVSAPIRILVDSVGWLIRSVKLGAEAVINFWTSMTSKSQSEKDIAKKNLDLIGQDYANLLKDIKDEPGKILNDVKNIWAKTGKESGEAFTNSFNDAMSNKSTGTSTNKTESKDTSSVGGIDNTKLEKDLSVTVGLFSSAVSNIDSQLSGLGGSIANSFSNIATTMVSSTASAGQQIGSVVQGIASTISSAFQIAAQATSDFFSSQIANLQTLHSEEIDAINTRLATELEMIENDGMTKEQKQQQQLEKLQAQLKAETDAKKKEDIQKQISELKKQQAETKAKKDADKEKAESDYKLAKAKWELDKQQFEINKAMSAITAAIQFALGLVMLWANVWSMGPIAGAILGGVMTGVLTGIFAANLAIILSKSFDVPQPQAPSFQVGGIAQDNTIANVNRGEMILNADQQATLFNSLNNSGGNQTINLVMDGDIIRTWIINNQQREAFISV